MWSLPCGADNDIVLFLSAFMQIHVASICLLSNHLKYTIFSTEHKFHFFRDFKA